MGVRNEMLPFQATGLDLLFQREIAGEDKQLSSMLYMGKLIISVMFQVPTITICECYARHPKLFWKNNLNSLMERLDTAVKYIEPKYILRDITVLLHSATAIASRMEQVKAVGIESPRPAMIKCSQEKLNRIIELHLTEKTARGQHDNVVSFLAEKLSLDVERVRTMLDKCPKLYRFSMANVRYNF